MSNVWRVKLNSQAHGQWDETKACGRTNLTVGIGWGPAGARRGDSLTVALDLLEQTDEWAPAGRRVAWRLTEVYEATLRCRDDGRLAVVAMKSGATNAVLIEALQPAASDGVGKAYAFPTHESHSAIPSELGTVPSLEAFAAAHPELLAPRVSRWL
ncbi:hypothetical protein AB0L40_18470 [Patulibacter sp. NPDC049589]|uniref:hypothetical protein n=1 Tax=Patulibacter sp. NPDC049589 TaxID=3154731 RepID=UPI00343E8B86